MLSFIPNFIRIPLTYLLFFINVIFMVVVVFYPILLLKIIFSPTPLRKFFDKLLTYIGECWMLFNNSIMALMIGIEWDVEGVPEEREEAYLVTSNHQSWVDIVVLQKILLWKTAFPRFFLKQELMRVPLLNFAWWGLDFPFMKRYSKAHLEKHPEDKGKDIEATIKSCAHFKGKPISLINFFEGTRFSDSKHERQQSPFKYLLKPKAGGAAFTLKAMDGAITKLLDITIVYPTGKKTFSDLFANKIKKVIVRARVVDIPAKYIEGDYENDPVFKQDFQDWITHLWGEKDQQMQKIHSKLTHS